ncbi:MAG: RidA family protein [Arenicellales bacterium]|nr:RidA family protein [Gammaproteobacteria bacterium]NDA15246.1 RidA family protein [Gammaproteobacteria bacterium]NDG44607.1 RidA family protein [Gammaproteobacteria bacterium]
MSSKQAIQSDNAPAPIGPYSQAVKVGDTMYLSGQVPLDPVTGELIDGDIDAMARRIFDNLAAVMAAAGGSLADIVKLTIYLVDLNDFAKVNAVMAEYFQEPYPSRATVAIAGLPKGAPVEVEAIAHF